MNQYYVGSITLLYATATATTATATATATTTATATATTTTTTESSAVNGHSTTYFEKFERFTNNSAA